MAEGDFHRNVAYKLRIGDLLLGKPIMNGEKFAHLELGDKKIVRVNVVGNVVDKYESSGETRYLFLIVDDGSGQIKLKVFGDDVVKFKNYNQGETVVVIGVLRHWNNETYIQPEIVKVHDPKYLLIRKLEIEKERSKNSAGLKVEKSIVIALRDKLLDRIKSSEDDGGVEVEKLIIEIRDSPPDLISSEIKKLIEDGIVFEPRPGKIRYLG
jgi:RPA family protein